MLAGGRGDDHEDNNAPVHARSVKLNNQIFELSPDLLHILRFCLTLYRTPPTKLLCQIPLASKNESGVVEVKPPIGVRKKPP